MSFKSSGRLHVCRLAPFVLGPRKYVRNNIKPFIKKYVSYNLTNSSTTQPIHFDSDAFSLRVFGNAEHKIN